MQISQQRSGMSHLSASPYSDGDNIMDQARFRVLQNLHISKVEAKASLNLEHLYNS